MLLRNSLYVFLMLAAGSPLAFGEEPAYMLFEMHCASCHGESRLGGTGPALIPESLARIRPETVAKTINDGRPATKMPAFGDTLSDSEISSLAKHVLTPLENVPQWGEAEISASRSILGDGLPADKPTFDADPLNLFIVVEAGDHHATLLDGDRFEPLDRFETRFALHGGPKFSPNGRFVFFMSRDGWITKYDIWGKKPILEVRAGINSRNIAISADGKYLAVANYLPRTLVILDAQTLGVLKNFDVAARDGNTSRVSAVYQAPQRNSFIAALKDVPEVWEISTDPEAEPVYGGLVHSHEKGMVEGLAESSGLFALRRIAVPEPIDDFFFDPPYRHLIGANREGNKGYVINLNVGRDIASIDLPGLPHLGSGISWEWNGRPVVATPHLKEPLISIIDMTSWKVIKTLKTDGPGFFLRGHEKTPYVWADVSGGKNNDRIHIIDKRTLEIVKTITPEPGRLAAHVEFDREGRHALVSIAATDGALLIMDAATFKIVKRLPMSKPSGKYNVWNKTRFSSGTSH